MPNLETDKFHIHYSDTGTGEPVVLLHAGATSAAHWRKVEPLLSDRYRVLAPDLLNFGESRFRSLRKNASHADHAELVRALIRQVARGPVHLVGHSFGGATAARLARCASPLVKSLVLIEPVLTPFLHQAGEKALHDDAMARAFDFINDAEAGRASTAWQRFIDGHNGPGTWASLSENARERFITMTLPTVAAHMANLANPITLADMSHLDMPAHVICGEMTDESFRKICAITWTHMRGCGYTTISGAGHMSPLTHAETVAGTVDEFISADRRDLAQTEFRAAA